MVQVVDLDDDERHDLEQALAGSGLGRLRPFRSREKPEPNDERGQANLTSWEWGCEDLWRSESVEAMAWLHQPEGNEQWRLARSTPTSSYDRLEGVRDHVAGQVMHRGATVSEL